ncbi:WD repeat-containing protein 43 [Linum grandiflorum]
MGAEAATGGGSSVSIEKKKSKKKRAASHLDDHVISVGTHEAVDGVLVEDDLLEPTIGEKLASVDLHDGPAKLGEAQGSLPLGKLPSADSVNVLLKQALHADDRSLLLDCLYTKDEKVIANSVSSLSMSDVLLLLNSLVTIIESRGAVLACALPWLRNLLLLHAKFRYSPIQLMESRVSTFQSALELSSYVDLLYPGIADDEEDVETIAPAIYEDKDDSDNEQESESDDAMETEEEIERFDGLTDSEEDMDD